MSSSISDRKTLARERQCAHCPWKKSTNPYDIPHGYDPVKHHNLKSTIAEPGSLERGSAMACHESPVGKETYCIGWLVNQLGPGNNIPLRIQMLGYDLSKVKTDGDQHACFEDTLPTSSLD